MCKVMVGAMGLVAVVGAWLTLRPAGVLIVSGAAVLAFGLAMLLDGLCAAADADSEDE